MQQSNKPLFDSCNKWLYLITYIFLNLPYFLLYCCAWWQMYISLLQKLPLLCLCHFLTDKVLASQKICMVYSKCILSQQLGSYSNIHSCLVVCYLWYRVLCRHRTVFQMFQLIFVLVENVNGKKCSIANYCKTEQCISLII